MIFHWILNNGNAKRAIMKAITSFRIFVIRCGPLTKFTHAHIQTHTQTPPLPPWPTWNIYNSFVLTISKATESKMNPKKIHAFKIRVRLRSVSPESKSNNLGFCGDSPGLQLDTCFHLSAECLIPGGEFENQLIKNKFEARAVIFTSHLIFCEKPLAGINVWKYHRKEASKK